MDSPLPPGRGRRDRRAQREPDRAKLQERSDAPVRVESLFKSMSKGKTVPDKSIGNKGEWTEKVLNPHLTAEPEQRVTFTTSSSLPLERVYASEDWPTDSPPPQKSWATLAHFPLPGASLRQCIAASFG